MNMNMKKRKSMDDWIREALNDPDKDGPCSMLVLVHMVGEQQKEIHAVKFTGKTWAEKDLAEMMRGKAETYCQDLPGVQTFQLLAFYKSTHPEAFYPFIVNNISNTNGLFTENLTSEEGRRSAHSRREEMFFQQMFQFQRSLNEHAGSVIDRYARHNEQLHKENMDAYGIVKDMLMEKSLNDHKFKMERLQYERDSDERKKWMQWGPMLINTIVGREVFPQSVADTSLVESIADSLKEDDIMKLAGVIDPKLLGPLMARVEQFIQKKEDEQKQKMVLRELASPDPEADAAGDVIDISKKKLKK